MLTEYLEPQFKASKILEKRHKIHNSKQLNAFLHSNLVGLQILFDDSQIKGVFQYASIAKLLPELPDISDDELTLIIKSNFVYC